MAVEQVRGLIAEVIFEGLGQLAACVHKVVQVDDNGTNMDDVLKEERVYDVNETFKGLAVPSAAFVHLVLMESLENASWARRLDYGWKGGKG